MTTDIIVSTGDDRIELTSRFALESLRAQYEAYVLTIDDLDAFLDLQSIGQMEGFVTGNGHFIKPRGYSDLKAHIRAGMPVIGVRHIPTGQHVAQALLTDPAKPQALNLEAYPLAMGDRIVQSFYIHPDHRFSVLTEAVRNVCHPAALLFERAATLTRADGGIRMVAKIAEDNKPSLKSFERGGFDQTLSVAMDPSRGHRVRYVAAQIMQPMAVQPAMRGDRMEGPCPL